MTNSADQVLWIIIVIDVLHLILGGGIPGGNYVTRT